MVSLECILIDMAAICLFVCLFFSSSFSQECSIKTRVYYLGQPPMQESLCLRMYSQSFLFQVPVLLDSMESG